MKLALGLTFILAGSSAYAQTAIEDSELAFVAQTIDALDNIKLNKQELDCFDEDSVQFEESMVGVDANPVVVASANAETKTIYRVSIKQFQDYAAKQQEQAVVSECQTLLENGGFTVIEISSFIGEFLVTETSDQ